MWHIILLVIISMLALRLIVQRKAVKGLKQELARAKTTLTEKADAGQSGQVKLEAILSSMFEGLLVVDKKFRILLMNPSLRKIFMIGIDPEGKELLEVIRNAQLQNIVERTIKLAQGFISEDMVLLAPQERFIKVNSVPIARNGRTEGAVLVFHDISELRQLERLRQDFVANVSHELRTPLANIKGYAETLLEGAIRDTENAADFVRIIYHDSERLAKLIDDLLDLSAIESGRLSMVFLPVDIRILIKQVIAVLEKAAKQKHIEISAVFPQDLPDVLADKARLSQVIVNLLDNAIKYSPQDSLVKFEAHRQADFLQIDVSDTGMGVPEKDIPRIFERFYRVDKARSRELGGTGLGLSIVKHIVIAHNGRVWVKSVIGKGSTFSFTIPIA